MGSERLQSSVLWAAELHAGQWRDGDNPLPYLCHPLEVLSILRTVGGVVDDDMLCAAVLHDALEMTSATLAEIEVRFGREVSGLVLELTRREPDESSLVGLTKDEIWTLRAGMLIEDIAGMGTNAMTIKLCDRISNLREARSVKSVKKLARYQGQTMRILETIPRKTHSVLWDLLSSDTVKGESV